MENRIYKRNKEPESIGNKGKREIMILNNK